MELRFGFLSVRKHAEHGYFGGYLILNRHSRPLEFHCTLPVKPSRAQTLLYGATLDDFVCGEQIAHALVSKAKIKPDVVLTDTRPAMALQHVTSTPVLLVAAESGPAKNASHDAIVTPGSPLQTRVLGHPADGSRYTVECLVRSEHSSETVSQLLESLQVDFDLQEPFQRIVEALLEAHPIMQAA